MIKILISIPEVKIKIKKIHKLWKKVTNTNAKNENNISNSGKKFVKKKFAKVMSKKMFAVILI